MKTKDQKSMKYNMINCLATIEGSVVLRQDLSSIGSARQISRVILQLITEKKLVKIGMGIYAKAYISQYSGMPLIDNGPNYALREALTRLGVAYESGSAEKKYNEGQSTQVPVRNIVKLKSRCRRRIAYLHNELIFEGRINAK